MRVCLRILGWNLGLSYEKSSLSATEGRKYFDDKSRKQWVPLQKNHEIGIEMQNFHEIKVKFSWIKIEDKNIKECSKIEK